MARASILANKIPKGFKQAVLRRLLPPAADLARLDRAQLAKLLVYKDELEHLIETDPVRFFEPSPGAQHAFLTCWDTEPDIHTVLFLAGNKAGKTTGGAILIGERLYGGPLWGRDQRTVSWPVPSRGAVFAEDFESHSETIIPTIKSWFPRGFIKRTTFNNQGHITSVEFQNGSLLHCKTFAQGSDAAEGKDWDFVWFDEPPPRSLYTAALRGLVTRGGVALVTATLLKEPWLYDESERSSVRAYQSSIHDNPWLSSEAKMAFLDSLPDEEREVREYGKPVSLTGLVYRSFMDRPPHVIELDNLPTDCPYIIGVDPHERRPLYAEWAFLTPQGEVVWFDWICVRGDTETILQALREKESSHPRPPVLCIMDPNRGPAKQLNQTSWQEVFEAAGYDVLLGNDDMNIGHTAMYNYLKIDKVSKRPKMMWSASCRGHGGPVYQMLRYSWDDWAAHTRHSRDAKEKPKQAYKDFPDIHRYVAMAELDYRSLLNGPEIVNNYPKNWRAYGQVA